MNELAVQLTALHAEEIREQWQPVVSWGAEYFTRACNRSSLSR